VSAPLLLLLLSAAPPLAEPGDWAAQRGRAALQLDTQPGNPALWLTYCQAGWRRGDRGVLEACAEQAAGPARATAVALRTGSPLPDDNAWALRALLALAEQRGDEGAARQWAQRLFEAEPNNRWALERAVHAALRGGDGPAAIDLSLRGAQRFGEPFVTLMRRAEALSDKRAGTHWLLFGGSLLLLIVMLRKVRRRASASERRRGTRR
jgi:hypothetical protein